MQPVGIVRGPYTDTAQIPKGCDAKHDAEDILEILSEFEEGLTDIEGFSHLFVIWAFDQAEGYDLLNTPPSDTHPHGVFTTRAPRRPNPIGLTVVQLLRRDGRRGLGRGLLGSAYHRASARRGRLHPGDHRGVREQSLLGDCCGHRGVCGAGAARAVANVLRARELRHIQLGALDRDLDFDDRTHRGHC